jgi:hypothetical protein
MLGPLRRLIDSLLHQLDSALLIAFVTAVWWEKRR